LTVWLRDACGALFRALAAPPARRLEPAERSWRHRAAGICGVNCGAFEALVPESVLLEAQRSVPMPPEMAAWIAAVGQASAADAAAALGRVEQLIGALDARLSPVSDAALRRQLRIFRGDIAEVATDVSPVH